MVRRIPGVIFLFMQIKAYSVIYKLSGDWVLIGELVIAIKGGFVP